MSATPHESALPKQILYGQHDYRLKVMVRPVRDRQRAIVERGMVCENCGHRMTAGILVCPGKKPA